MGGTLFHYIEEIDSTNRIYKYTQVFGFNKRYGNPPWMMKDGMEKKYYAYEIVYSPNTWIKSFRYSNFIKQEEVTLDLINIYNYDIFIIK